MRITKAVRRFVCRTLVGAILFTQFAIAAYACPELSLLPISTYALSDDFDAERDLSAAVACPMATENDEATLCGEHCKYGHTASNGFQGPIVPPALLGARHALEPQLQRLKLSLPAFASRPAPPAPASHAILHCSFLV